MTGNIFWVNLVLGALFALGCCCVLALFSQPIRVMFSSLFAIFYRPFSQILERTSGYLRSAKAWILRQVEDESDRKGDGPLYFIIGAVLYTLLTALFIMCDFGMIVLTVQAMGMDEFSFELPMDTSTLTAATLVTTSLFWGAILFDLLGVTHLAPWRRSLSERNRKLFMGISIFFVAMTVFLGVSMAYWRGISLNQFVPEAEAAPAEFSFIDQGSLNLSSGDGVDMGGSQADLIDDELPLLDTSSDWIILASLMGISGLSLASTAFSMVGLGIMAKFTILLVICLGTLLLLPICFTSWLFSTLLDLIFNFIQRILDVFVQVGSALLGLFGWRQDGSEISDEYSGPEEPTGPKQGEEPKSEPRVEPPSADPGFNPFPGR